MFLPSDSKLDIGRLSQVFNNTVATYKYYWFLSIIDRLCEENRREFSFVEIIIGMIADAWYPVHYFKLSFGKSDSLYDRIVELQSLLNIPIDADKEKIRKAILSHADEPAVRKCLAVFTLNVPYWFLSPWIKEKSPKEVAEMSNHYYGYCPYAIVGQRIIVSEEWADYIRVNAAVMKDFCYWNLSGFIQKRNPNVPDIPSKLVKPVTRSSLSVQHKYWNRYLDSTPDVHCIYTGREIQKGEYDLDHFIPWSFVAHDLLWNLIPVDPSINSSKNNNIPSLEQYLKPMAQMQKDALTFNYSNFPNDKVIEDFLVFRCTPRELIDLSEEDFFGLYYKQISPMVQIATNMGFAEWKRI